MSRCRDLLIRAALGIALCAVLAVGPVVAGPPGLGRLAQADEIAAWDRDVRPDGTGLPDGAGPVAVGEGVFADNCALCHGDFAEGVDNWPSLSGGVDTLDHDDPQKTVGSYWPYLSTLWDYINRSKPYGNAQSLTPDQVYAVVAFLLYANDIVDDDFTLTKDNFLEVAMPNADGFIVDDRALTEYPLFGQPRCMVACKDAVEITMRAATLGVTPGSNVAETADPGLLAAGAQVFAKCKACHQIGDDARHKIGPALTGIVGARAGAADGFRYSKAMRQAVKGGLVWTQDQLAGFLANPKTHMKGTKMSFAGIKTDGDLRAVIAYLASFPG